MKNNPPSSPHARTHSLARRTSGLLLALVVNLSLCIPASRSRAADLPKAAGDLYQIDKVWTLHLRFTADQWTAMEPKGGNRGMFGGPRGGFGPAMFLAPVFITQADADKDTKLTRAEFAALADRWFTAWDKDGRGTLNAEQLRAGLNTAFAPPAPPAGAPPAPGAPGGAPRMPAFNLQGPEGKRNGLAATMGIEFPYVHADLEFEGQTLKDVAVRYKGNGTWMQSQGSLKRSMKIDLNEFVKGQKLAGVTTLNLHTNVTDASSMNEPLAHRLYRDAGVPAPRATYARVYVTVPGKHDRAYLGLYSVIENIDKNFIREATGNKGGSIFKPVTPALFADLGDDWTRYQQTYDPKTELTVKQARRVIDFARLLTKADDAEFATKVGDYLDLDAFARFMAVTTWLTTLDSILGMGQNFYVYLDPKTDKFQFLPWDLDHAFGQFPIGSTQEARENLSIRHPWRGDVRLLERVFKVDAFMKLYLAKMEEFSRTIFKPERFHQQVDQVAAAIRPAIKDEPGEKLARFEKAAAGESVELAPLGGAGQRGFAMPPVKPIKAFVDPRARSVLDQLAGKSEGQQIDLNFGRPGGGPGGPGGPGGGGGPGGARQAFAPANFLAPVFTTALDADKDGQFTRDEFTTGFAKWFAEWDTEKTGVLTDDQLRAGLNKDFAFRPPPAPPAPPAPPKPAP